jgi:hypothetical protein
MAALGQPREAERLSLCNFGISVNSSGATWAQRTNRNNIQISDGETPADEISSSLALLCPAPRSFRSSEPNIRPMMRSHEYRSINEAVGKATHRTDAPVDLAQHQRICVRGAAAARISASFSAQNG